MAARPIPWGHVYVIDWRQHAATPDQEESEGVGGVVARADSGVVQRRGNVTLAARQDGDYMAHRAAFERWHDSLRGNDNQASVQPYAGIFTGAVTTSLATFTWTSIAPRVQGGSTVVLAYTPADADVAAVLAVGQPIRIGRTETRITEVTSAGAAGAATVVVEATLPAATPSTETDLSTVSGGYDWSTAGGLSGLGATEGAGGRLLAPFVVSGSDTKLVFVDPATGTPDLAAPVLDLTDPTFGGSWFLSERGVSGIAALGGGRYCIVEQGANPVYAIGLPTGRLKADLSDVSQTSTPAYSSGALFATSAGVAIPGLIRGASVVGSTLYIIDSSGRLSRIAISELTQTRDGGSSTYQRLDYVPVTVRGQIASTAGIAGLWTFGGRLRTLRRVGAAWAVYEITDGSPPTVEKVYDVPTRPYRGAAELGGALYATTSDNKFYRNTRRSSGDVAVEAGTAATLLQVDILAKDVQWPLSGQRQPVVTYGFREIV